MKNSIVLVFIILYSCTSLCGQSVLKKYFNSILKDTVSEERAKLTIIPTIAYSPETKLEIGFTTLYVYKAKERIENRISEINGFTFFTLNDQYGLSFSHALYTDYNDFFFLGEFKFKKFPFQYYGIGSNSPNSYLAKISSNEFLIKERILRKIKKSLYTGLEISFQRLTNVDIKDNEIETFEPISSVLGIEGNTNLSLGWGVVYDDRHNILNSRKGFYSELAFLTSNSFWGSDFNFSSFIFDNRVFKPINKRDVLAVQLYTKVNTGDVPFNELALVGGNQLMRGYYLGRYRDRAMYVSQVEYRMLPFPFSKRWGATGFLSAGSVAEKVNKFTFNELKLSGGAGLRFAIFPKKDIYARFDYAFTNQGTGFYIAVGEAF